MTTTDSSLSKFERSFLGALFSLVIVLIAMDLYGDRNEGVDYSHLLMEFAVGIFSAVGLVVVLRKSFLRKTELKRASESIGQLKAEAIRWREENKKWTQGFSEAIEKQLRAWNLTDAERDVAFLLIKGLSFKEIAEARGTSEKTARTQSAGVYEKSKLANRSELAAFFLEDLLGPRV